VADVYLYYYTTRDSPSGEGIRSVRPATLAAIKSRGEPVMESQIVVDHTELDADGFLGASASIDSYSMNDTAAEIWSLGIRAASRDSEANDSADDIEKYMLSLESRELRKQAQSLKSGLPQAAGAAAK
jgi:hypothetical protein